MRETEGLPLTLSYQPNWIALDEMAGSLLTRVRPP